MYNRFDEVGASTQAIEKSALDGRITKVQQLTQEKKAHEIRIKNIERALEIFNKYPEIEELLNIL